MLTYVPSILTSPKQRGGYGSRGNSFPNLLMFDLNEISPTELIHVHEALKTGGLSTSARLVQPYKT